MDRDQRMSTTLRFIGYQPFLNFDSPSAEIVSEDL